MNSLMAEMGDILHSTQTFEYGRSDPALATDAERLKAYFHALDSEMAATQGTLNEDDIKARTID